MTSGIYVTYDGNTLSPTPLVNYSQQPVEFGYVYGYNTDITLEGLYTGISTTGAAINYLTGVFANQFRALNVTDNQSNTLYSWSGVTVDSVTFDSGPWLSESFVKYTIKLRSYSLPSGVIEPSNEFSFTQNEDSSVTAIHRISARGVRNSAGAFDNAVAFVRQFTGKDPYANCAAIFVPSGSGILASITENVNRADGAYSVIETYRYNSGASTPYTRSSSLDISELMDSEYRTIDYSLKLQGSPVRKNLSSVISSLPSIVNLTDIQSEFGISTSNWVKNTYVANIDSGSVTIDININYVSGANTGGFFDYDISYEEDLLTATQTWKIDGDFKCFGPLEFKADQLNNFRSNVGSDNWKSYLTGIIMSSTLWGGWHDGTRKFSPNCKVVVNENQALYTLRLSLVMEDGYEPVGLSELSYSMDVAPSRWIYELMPSANIEGSYVIQDLQSKTQTRQKITVVGKSSLPQSKISSVSGYVSGLSNTYVNTGSSNNVTAFLIENLLTTGTYDLSASNTWIGADNGISSGSLGLKSAGSISDNAPTRPGGYNFGY